MYPTQIVLKSVFFILKKRDVLGFVNLMHKTGVEPERAELLSCVEYAALWLRAHYGMVTKRKYCVHYELPVFSQYSRTINSFVLCLDKHACKLDIVK